MYTTKDEIQTFIKEEFEKSSFMIDLGKQIPRKVLFDMFLRAEQGLIWFVVYDCLILEQKEFDF